MHFLKDINESNRLQDIEKTKYTIPKQTSKEFTSSGLPTLASFSCHKAVKLWFKQ